MLSLRLDLNIFFFRERKSVVILKFCILNIGVFIAWIDIVICKQYKNVKYVKYQYRNYMDLIIFRIIGKF